jgi:hypothetical protein
MVSIGKNVQIVRASSKMMTLSVSNSIQGKFCIIKDCVRIEDNSVLIPGTVYVSFTVFAGNPGNIRALLFNLRLSLSAVQVCELPESFGNVFMTNAKESYDLFKV